LGRGREWAVMKKAILGAVLAVLATGCGVA